MKTLACVITMILALSTSRSAVALQVTTVSIATRDLIYNSADGRLYASIPGSVPTYGNTVTAIDPATGELGPSVFVGSEPGKLALSDDGRTLYVALQGAAAVRVVDLQAMTAGLQFSLGSDAFFGPYLAEDMAVQPGHPAVLAVSLMYSGVSPRHAGVAIFDNGVARPTKTPGHTGSNRIEFSSDPTRLYGYNNETTEFGFRRLLVNDLGVSQVDVSGSLIGGFSVDIHYAQGRVYSTNGKVVDPEARALLGTFTFESFESGQSVAVDTESAYYVTGAGKLYEFDLEQFTPILTQAVPGVSGTPRGLVRWGDDGLAFRTEGQVLLLTRIHEPPTCDLALTQTDSSDPVPLGGFFSYRLAVRNAGGSTATGVIVRDRYPANAALQYAYSSSTYCSDSSGTVVCQLGSIAPGDSAIVTVNMYAPNAGTLENTAWVATPVLDTDDTNNASTETTLVKEPERADVHVGQSHAPVLGSVGRELTFTLIAANAGPDSAGAVGLSHYAHGVSVTHVSATPSRGTCVGSGGYVSCDLGSMAAGESVQVVVVVVPTSPGMLTSQVQVNSSTADPSYGNNVSYETLEVRLSAETLLDALMVLVRSYQLRNGLEKALVADLEAAASALGAPDTSSACGSLGDFRHRIGKMAGRHLTLTQAVRLDADANEIASLLGCRGAALAAGVATERSGLGFARAFSFRSVAPAGDATPRVRLSVPAPVRARLEVFDVRGRLVRVAHEAEVPAGDHEWTWDGRSADGTRAPSGLYFMRITAGRDRGVARVTMLR